MTDKIDGLVTCMQGLVDDLARVGLDWRLTVVPFGDFTIPGDRIVTDQPFVKDAQSAKHLLASMPRFSGRSKRGRVQHRSMIARVPEAIP